MNIGADGSTVNYGVAISESKPAVEFNVEGFKYQLVIVQVPVDRAVGFDLPRYRHTPHL